jgi:ribonucleoside-diphosphate reductase alpha chain
MLDLRVVKRTGEVVDFDPSRIQGAITKAVRAVGRELSAASVDKLVDAITEEIRGRFHEFYPNVENIQDIVEKYLVKEQLYEIAKAYILYRADRQKARAEAQELALANAQLGRLTVRKRDGRTQLLNIKTIEDALRRAARGVAGDVAVDEVAREVIKSVYDQVETEKIDRAMVLAAASFIERDPAYGYVAARLLLQRIYKEVMGCSIRGKDLSDAYRRIFVAGIRQHVEQGLLAPKLGELDLERMAAALRPERDHHFQYLGLQTLYERYFLRREGIPTELPQGFWMRVAMGLAAYEDQGEDWAIEFYELMSQLRYVPSTPTLFHAGTPRPQLSSCYLTTVEDDLRHIFKCFGDNSQLSKWSGGIGNDWSNIRATGSPIKSTHVESQGVIPFLKIANDVTNAINRSGKRRGATCAYLETWHYDVEDFLDLRKNTGDERRRTHDMNTANWIPDLFMKRVAEGGEWTLFSPDEVSDLHHLYGRAFERRYLEYEERARRGEMRLTKTVEARGLWRRMLTMLFETGHPWITFKDPCNVRSPQDHMGVIHSSNLCTEITLNTSADETAVCNLGSINLARHMRGGKLDDELLARSVHTALRMLDNVIDVNFYPTEESKSANLRHRPVGLGLMGFQDSLFEMGLAFESDAALEFADSTHELISYHAILASSELARERGVYASYKGSKWDRGLFPIDTLELLERERGVPVEISRASRLDWTPVREHVARYGMRNSNTMAIAPTATIANIAGCFPCIEPIYKNIYVKANISGEFTVVNRFLVEDLKRLDLWNQDMLDQLKYYDGNVSAIAALPAELKDKYKEAFEIDPIRALEITATRGKWIDQSQSHNVFMKGRSGKQLSDVYRAAWRFGLKTTYYLRTMAATQIEKSTLDAARFGYTQKREYLPVAAAPEVVAARPLGSRGGHGSVGGGNGSVGGSGSGGSGSGGSGASRAEELGPGSLVRERPEPSLCRIDDPDCEACQ